MRLLFLLFLSFIGTLSYSQTALHELVNPFIGTGGHGHTYPGVSAPFGMMQLSPDSRLDGWDGCGGYHYSDSVIYGFSHTHLSGTGVSDYGDLLIMPFIGEGYWENGSQDYAKGYGSTFQHENENAHAGYYNVLLDKHNINVSLTTTERAGYHRYTYPKWEKKKVIIDLSHRDMLIESDLILLNDSTLIGKRISNAWAKEQHFYFTIQFSEAAVNSTFHKNENGKPDKLILEFGHQNPILDVKVGMSAVDINGAKRNLSKEIPEWDFDRVRTYCEKKWDDELGKVLLEDRNENNLVIFYTALYHSFLNPNLFSDQDGRYRGMDQQIHQLKSDNQYTVFSLWDTFRAAHPLFTILQEKRTPEFIRTMLRQYQDGGILPIWELSGNYTGCMIGYHGIPVIVDAYMKGYKGFDPEVALNAMVHSANQNHLGLDFYKEQGYISSEDESESVSKTLEYAYDDWCIAEMAKKMGKDSIATLFYERSAYYRTIFNRTTLFAQPRYNGGWRTGFQPAEVTFDYTEANAWQYTLFAPHDIDGLIEMMGGRDELESWLDRLFSASSETTGRQQADITGLIGQYAHGNEPSHHMAYLYNYTKSAGKTQQYVHQILTTLYHNAPDGLSGNEDCGQMSAWYVLSSLGFYPVTPGNNTYMIGTPHFKKATVRLENGKELIISRMNDAAGNSFVEDVILNGDTLTRNFLYHNEIMAGGTLAFNMGPAPSPYEGTFASTGINTPLLSSPVIENAVPSFEKKTRISLEKNTHEDVEIRYTTDGTEPTNRSRLYKKPIKLKKSTEIRLKSFSGDRVSKEVHGTFKRINTKLHIALISEYSNQYAAGGDRALIDQISGGQDFRTGGWQGYYDQDVIAIVDLMKKTKINQIGLRCIQDIRSWIWMPSEVEFSLSEDGQDWYTIGSVKTATDIRKEGAVIETFTLNKSFKSRYIRVTAKNRGICPPWHLGAGNPTWIFADELMLN